MNTNLLINEPPLQVLPSLAKKIGLHEAIFLQQLHFRLLISNNIREGHRWIYKSLADWHDEFPFVSYDTLKRVVAKLEKENYIITSKEFNKMKMDKTKWYRINYEKLNDSSLGQNAPTIGAKCTNGEGQNAPTIGAKCTNGEGQNAPTDEGKMHQPIPKNIRNIKDNSEFVQFAKEIIDYLNLKTGKTYRSTTSGTKRLINGRLSEGYTVDDFKRVIDLKTKQWLNDQNMNKYLRPNTLFSASNFENYVNEAPKTSKTPQNTTTNYTPPTLDFKDGEDL